MLMVGARAGLECFFDFCFLFLACEPKPFQLKMNLRYEWSFILWVNIVLTWSRVQMAVRDTLVFPNLCTNPICNVLLVHGVFVSVVFTWTRCIHVAALYIWFQTECKLRQLTTSFFRLCRVTEVKITQNSVIVRRWGLFIGCVCLSSLIHSKFRSLNSFLRNFWIVGLWTYIHYSCPLVYLKLLFWI